MRMRYRGLDKEQIRELVRRELGFIAIMTLCSFSPGLSAIIQWLSHLFRYWSLERRRATVRTISASPSGFGDNLYIGRWCPAVSGFPFVLNRHPSRTHPNTPTYSEKKRTRPNARRICPAHRHLGDQTRSTTTVGKQWRPLGLL